MATVAIKSKKSFIDEVKRDWIAIDQGEPAPEPVTRIYFESAEALSRVITKQRHHLLQVLHANGGVSIRALAVLLERNYKNVHQDVKILEDSGLIGRNGKGRIIAPFEKLTIELPLAVNGVAGSGRRIEHRAAAPRKRAGGAVDLVHEDGEGYKGKR